MLKKIIAPVYMLMILFVSGCDDYSETKIFFTSDKEIYEVGDTIILVINVVTEKEAKRIKAYSDLSNFNIEGLLKYERASSDEIQYRYERIEKKFVKPTENSKVLIYDISYENPFKPELFGILLEDENNYIISFSSIGVDYIINKEKYHDAVSFGFEGNGYPVNAPFGYSFENFIEFYPIVIK